MYSGNASQSYRQNPYFDGVLSALTTQGEVTANVRGDRWEVQKRMKNASSSRQTGTYPGGEDFSNHHVYPHELVFGWTDQKARFNFPGEPNEIGFSSLNGVHYEEYSTDEELMDNIYFIGLAKTPFVFDSLDQLKHGFTAIRVGSGTTFHTGSRPFYSGDVVEWSVVPRPNSVNANFAGGEYGGNADPNFGSEYNPGGRQGYPRYGTPRGKFRFIVNPAVRGDMRPGINGALSKMLKGKENGGVLGVPVEALFQRKSLGANARLSAYQCYAKATMVTDVIGACRVLEVLYTNGIAFARADVNNAVRTAFLAGRDAAAAAAAAVAGNAAAAVAAAIGAVQQPQQQNLATSAPARVLDVVQRTGIFDDTNTRVNPLMRDILRALYVDFTALGSSQASNDLYVNFRGAFAPNGRDVLVDLRSNDTRYVNVALSLANLRQGSYDKAVAHKTRRHCGIALSPSESGQRLDVLLGHFLNAGNFSQ